MSRYQPTPGQRAAHRAAGIAKYAAAVERGELRRCSECNEGKPRGDFAFGVLRCRPCQQRRQSTPEQQQRNYARNRARRVAEPEWRARVNALKTQCRGRDDPERERELAACRRARWAAKDPERARVSNINRCARRRARRRGLPATLTDAQYVAIIRAYGDCCAYCGAAGVLEQDHLIAYAQPGCPGHTPGNVVPACRSCNASKREWSLAEWFTRPCFPERARVRVTVLLADGAMRGAA